MADDFDGGAGGGGVARAPKNERMLFWALMAEEDAAIECLHISFDGDNRQLLQREGWVVSAVEVTSVWQQQQPRLLGITTPPRTVFGLFPETSFEGS